MATSQGRISSSTSAKPRHGLRPESQAHTAGWSQWRWRCQWRRGRRAAWPGVASRIRRGMVSGGDGDSGHHWKLDQDPTARPPSRIAPDLDQNAEAKGRPATHHRPVGNLRPIGVMRGAIETQQHALHAQHTGQQHRIGGGDGGFRRQQHRAQHQQAGQQRGFRIGHRKGAPHRQPAGRDGAQQRRQTIGPDLVVAATQERAGQSGRRRLQPINADGFFIAGDMAEADIHRIAGFHHLAGGLGETALIAVQRRQAEYARQPQQQPQQRQQGKRPPRQAGQPAGAATAGAATVS